MENFLYQHNLTNIVKEGTCFKNSSKPSTIDLFLTNNSSYFQNTKTFFTGLSDFHKLVTTTLKISIPKNKPLQINYRNYKHFNEYSFNEDLKLAFNNTDIQTSDVPRPEVVTLVKWVKTTAFIRTTHCRSFDKMQNVLSENLRGNNLSIIS